MISFDANGSPVDGPDTHIMAAPAKLVSLLGILSGFRMLGTHPFPEHLCVHQDDREKGVYNASEDDYHVVVAVDSRFTALATIRVMRPYKAYDPDSNTMLFGWIDKDWNFLSHGENPIYDPDLLKVVAWKPCPKDLDLRA